MVCYRLVAIKGRERREGVNLINAEKQINLFANLFCRVFNKTINSSIPSPRGCLSDSGDQILRQGMPILLYIVLKWKLKQPLEFPLTNC